MLVLMMWCGYLLTLNLSTTDFCSSTVFMSILLMKKDTMHAACVMSSFQPAAPAGQGITGYDRHIAESSRMHEAPFNQDAWLARIGYRGALTPTLETLNRLILAHSHSISYETLDIMLGLPPKLDIGTLQAKMIAGGRGGYCFEQNML